MPHPHKRTWTLERLDRTGSYRLWFDPVAFRWEIEPEGAGTDPAEGRAAGADRARAEDPPDRAAGSVRASGRGPRWAWVRPA
jgi:hypothetical protein